MSFLIRAYAPSDLPILHTIRAAAFAPVFASFRSIVGPEIAALGLAAAEQEQADLLDTIAKSYSGHTIAVAEIGVVIAGFVCAVTALCYAELAAMVPVSGSAYTYAYAVLGELVAWCVGWALVLEYAVAASAVCVGWSKYATGLVEHSLGIHRYDPREVSLFARAAYLFGIVSRVT